MSSRGAATELQKHKEKKKSSFITGEKARCSSSWNFSHQRQHLSIMWSFLCFRLPLTIACCCLLWLWSNTIVSTESEMKDSSGGGLQQEAFPFSTKNVLTTKPNQALFKAQNIFPGEDIIPFLLEGWEWPPQGQGTAKVINTKTYHDQQLQAPAKDLSGLELRRSVHKRLFKL